MAGYVRNDTPNNIADGNIINAADLDGEFDTLQTAFGAASGHSHSGATGEGKPVEKLGPAQDFSVSATAATPKTNNTLDLGATSFKFKDGFFAGKVDTGTITLGGTNVTSSAAELNLLDGVTATTTELNYVGGVTSAIQTQLGTKAPLASPALTGNVTVSDNSANPAVTITQTGAGAALLVEDSASPDATPFVITAAGNVGIGTSSPSAPVHVVSASTTGPTIRLQNAGSSIAAANETMGTIEFYSNDASVSATGVFGKIGVYSDAAFTGGGGNDAYMALFTNADSTLAERMRITSGGNVGIGTTAPAYTLEAAGVTRSIAATGTGNPQFLAITSDAAGIPFVTLQNATSSWQNRNNGTTGDLSWSVSGSERMRITLGGNVGIGTSSPAYKLDVNGSIGASGSVTISTGGSFGAGSIYSDGNVGMQFRAKQASPVTAEFVWKNSANSELMRIDTSGNVGIGTSSPSAKLELNAGTNTDLRINTSASGYLQVGQFANGAYIGTSSTDVTAGILRLGTGGTERMRIDASGNLGIGVTSPTTKLDVSGTVNATALSIGGTAITATAAELNFVDGVTSAIQTQLNAKAPLASPALTGTPTAPTATLGDNTTQIATTAFVNAEIANDAPSKTGTGASGTWPISISGNAATATSATSATSAGSVDGKSFGTFTAAGGIGYATDTATMAATAAGTAGQILLSGGAGVPTWSSSFTGDAGSVDGKSIGTLTAAGGIAYATSTTELAATAAGTAGQALLSGSGGAPTWGYPAQLSTASGTAPSYSCRAWVNFNGQGTIAIRGSANVTSVTDGGTGVYTLNFTTAMPDANYSITGVSAGSSTGSTSISGAGASGDFTRATGSVTIQTVDASGNTNADAITVCVAIFR